MDQVTDFRVHGGSIDDILSVRIYAVCHLGHKTKPDLSRQNLVHLAKTALKLPTLKLAWIAVIGFKDEFIEAIAIFGRFMDNLHWIEELFTALLDQLV